MRWLPRSPRSTRFILTAPLKNMEHLEFFRKTEVAGEAEDGSLVRLRGSCYNKSDRRVTGLLCGLG